jgi:hypothetical protein
MIKTPRKVKSAGFAGLAAMIAEASEWRLGVDGANGWLRQ